MGLQLIISLLSPILEYTLQAYIPGVTTTKQAGTLAIPPLASQSTLNVCAPLFDNPTLVAPQLENPYIYQ